MFDLTKTIAKLDFSDDAAVKARLAKLAAPNDATVYGKAATFFYHVGLADRETKPNAPRDVKGLFAAFSAAQWCEANGRKAITTKTADNYGSAFGAMYLVGGLPYDATPVVDFCTGTLKGNYGSRAAVIRNIVAAHPAKCPTPEQMAELIPLKKKETLLDVVDGALEDLQEAAGEGGTFAAMLVPHPQADLAIADAIAALALAKRYLPTAASTEAEDAVARAEAKRKALEPVKK
jgi:hypothetical protein